MIQKLNKKQVRNIYTYIIDRNGAAKIVNGRWIAWSNWEDCRWVLLEDNSMWTDIYDKEEYIEHNIPYPLTDLNWEKHNDTETWNRRH